MKKVLLHLFCIPILLFATGSCKKACYTCNALVISAYQIDTFYHYGQVRYDTTGGGTTAAWTFTSCEVDSHYHYGDLTFSPIFKIDTVIDCQLNTH